MKGEIKDREVIGDVIDNDTNIEQDIISFYLLAF